MAGPSATCEPVVARRGRVAAVVATASTLSALSVLVLASTVVVPWPGLAGGCAAAAPTVRVGLVVDYGTGAGAPAGPRSECVTVPDGVNGFDVLTAGGHTFRLNGVGLLCAIDGYPATGCGERTPSGYRYWAYFHGSATGWTYMGIGPGSSRVRDGSVEGWRFVEGSGTPGDPTPRAPADPARICPPAPQPPPTTASPTTAAVPVPVPGPTEPTVTSAPPGRGAEPIAAPPAGAGPIDATASTAVGAADPAPGGTAPASSAPSDALGVTGTVAAVGAPTIPDTALAALPASSPASTGTPTLAFVVALAAIVVVGSLAAMRFRKGAVG